jgi:hypothetical protein
MSFQAARLYAADSSSERNDVCVKKAIEPSLGVPD